MNAVTEQAPVSNRQMVLAATASLLGWGLDLFDLFILLYVAPVVGKLFFPSDLPMLSLAATYASFAVTLLFRPTGAAIFGSLADLKGRKRAMVISIIGVGLCTASFGLLPTVPQIGVAASVLFLLLRAVQGIFVGGVVSSTHTIGVETVPVHWRGTMSGMVGGGGSGVGALFASIAFMVCSTLFPGDAFAVWGWRCMFFSGLLTSLVGLLLFKDLQESPFWQEMKRAAGGAGKPKTKTPLRTLLKGEYRNVFLVNLLLTTGAGAGYYLTSGYLPSFLKLVNKTSDSNASLILITTGIVATMSSILIGYLSDRTGRKRMFLIMGTGRLIALPLLILFMAGLQDPLMLCLTAAVIAFFGNGSYAPVLIFLNERFPTAIRASGTGLSWNIGFAIGGMMPSLVSLVATGGAADIPGVLAIFLAAVSVIFLIGAAVIPETRGTMR